MSLRKWTYLAQNQNAMVERPVPPRVQFLWFQDCPSYIQARQMLMDVLRARRLERVALEDIDATDLEVSKEYRFPGSPTIRVNGRDIEPGFEDPGEYIPRCRIYWTPGGASGIPAREWIEAALNEAISSCADPETELLPETKAHCSFCRGSSQLFNIGGTPRCLRHALSYRPLLRRSALTALFVGTILTTINQGNLLLASELPATLAWKVPLTYCVPFCVATWGGLVNNRLQPMHA
ncbi:MAG TPA: nitrate/nitrite transporter NrtS [Dehalococcoidia bacterium]|nr:nitrate/nitrite transporter NrtS [Dehalococcoidia bacterium]